MKITGFVKYFDLNYLAKKVLGDVDIKEQYARIKPIIKQKVADFIKDCTESKDKLKDIPGTNYNLGLLHMQRGNIEDAVMRFRMVTFLTPENIGAHYYLGRCLLLLGEDETAKEQFNLVLAADPNYADTQYQLQKIAEPESIKIIPKAMIEERSDIIAENYDPEIANERAKSSKTLVSTILANIKDKNPNLEVLDLGCGNGRCGHLLKQKEVAKKVVGVDISEKMLKMAGRLNIEGNDVYDQLVNKEIKEFLSANDEKFDLVLANLSFEYFGDLSEIAGLIKKSLRSGGTIGLNIRNEEIEENYILNASFDDFSHSAKYIKEQFTSLGFEELQVKEFELGEGESVNAFVFSLK